jgi:DNA mismatch repair protein MutL
MPMRLIKILPEGLIDRIAAGEVIENPASVIKELVENSIDAGARNIEISIIGGGKDEIIIVDDGEGIAKDQVELAFYRHATSKIKSWEDLLQTGTMGFRGEALPSISSVSIMELSTHYQGEKTGTSIRFEGGRQTFLGPAPPKKGCIISVRNLFYNVPARRKFLKSEISERRKISEVIRRYIIARPDIGFKVLIDGKLVNALFPKESLLSRLDSVWGNNIADSLLKIDQPKVGPLEITGYVSKPETNRATRSELFFFVNKRPVLEKTFFGAIAASYGRSLPPGRHPYAAVFLEIDPSFVDINVHPAKTEVRFADDGFIFNTLKKSLDKTLALPVSFAFRTPPPASVPGQSDHAVPFSQVRQEQLDVSDFAMRPPLPVHMGPETLSHSPVHSRGPQDSYLQIFDTYLLFRTGDGLLIIDQHTAHERILFEKTLDGFAGHGSPSQRLLFEERVKLTPQETSLIEELAEILAKAGFEIRSFGPEEIVVSGLPQEMTGVSGVGAIKEVLETYSSNLKEGFEMKRALAAAVACKAAVKAGQRLPEEQARGLFSELLKCREPYRCPHGRPTIVTLNKDDLEKIFKRK